MRSVDASPGARATAITGISEMAAARHREQRRIDLLAREIAGAAEEHQRVGARGGCSRPCRRRTAPPSPLSNLSMFTSGETARDWRWFRRIAGRRRQGGWPPNEEAIMNAAQRLHELGQSLWLDNLSREILDDGTLARYIREFALTGLTSNPTIFDKAIRKTKPLRPEHR